VTDVIRCAPSQAGFAWPGVAISVIALAGASHSAGADVFTFSSLTGLSAEAELMLLNPTTLQIRLRNTSTGIPNGFDAAGSLLTTFSWDFDLPGINPGDNEITGGTIVIGPNSQSLNFDTGSYGPGTNVGGEWGFGNMDGTGALINFISGNAAQATPFGGPNLDGPVSMDGPQAGLAASPLTISLGGLGAIQDEVIATVSLSHAILNLASVIGNGMRVEFGSNAAFINIPAPGALPALLVGACAGRRRRRR